jgi:hypothetical protein
MFGIDTIKPKASRSIERLDASSSAYNPKHTKCGPMANYLPVDLLRFWQWPRDTSCFTLSIAEKGFGI